MTGPGIKIIVITLMIIGLSACAYHDRQIIVQGYIDQTKKRPPPPLEPVPAFKPLPDFTYPEEKVRRSPFKERQMQTTLQALQPDLSRPKQPLESFPMDSLKFVGTLEEGPKRWALIRTPDGQVVRVHVGDYMGQNYGKVIAVSENSLIIEERLLDEGTWVKHVLTFRLEAVNLPKGTGRARRPPGS